MAKENEKSVLNDIKVEEFVNSRAGELTAIHAALLSKVKDSTRTALQLLPRHLRRRASSHNIKRLPHRLHDLALRQRIECPPKANKRPSSLYRKRVQASVRPCRTKKHAWLETHVWHAKRFHMTSLWGYKIPVRFNRKNIRTSFRAEVNQCVLVDHSYYCCIDIMGAVDEVTAALSSMLSSDAAHGLQKYDVRTEKRYVLYSRNTYPLGALGEAYIMWKANSPAEVIQNKEKCQLWLWTHPACYLLIWQELHKAFGVDAVNQQNSMTVGSVTLTSLKDQFCRFRLTGPVSLSVLQRVLQQSDGECAAEHNSVTVCADSEAQCQSRVKNSEVPWWITYYSSSAMRECYVKQWQHWALCGRASSPAQLQPHHVLALTVKDPRLTSCSSDSGNISCKTELSCVTQVTTTEHCQSAMWDMSVRQNVRMLMQATHSHSLAGLEPQQTAGDAHVPVLLVQRPGVRAGSRSCNSGCRAGFGCGYDIIVPAGWGRVFWMAIVKAGAFPIGLLEERMSSLETNTHLFPFDFPDTAACQQCTGECVPTMSRCSSFKAMKSASQRNDMTACCSLLAVSNKATHSPNDLQNFKSDMFASDEPRNFSCTTVLRNLPLLRKLQLECLPSQQQQQTRRTKQNNSTEMHRSYDVEQFEQLALGSTRNFQICFLVPVVVRAISGKPPVGAQICLASLSMANSQSKRMKYSTGVNSSQPGDFLPSERKVVGYVTASSFSLASGQSIGRGFITLWGFQRMLQAKPQEQVATVLICDNITQRSLSAYVDVVTDI